MNDMLAAWHAVARHDVTPMLCAARTSSRSDSSGNRAGMGTGASRRSPSLCGFTRPVPPVMTWEGVHDSGGRV